MYASGHTQTTATASIPRETLALDATSEVLAALMGGIAYTTSTLEVAAQEQRSFDKNDLMCTQFASLDEMGALERQARYRIWEEKLVGRSMIICSWGS